MNCYGVYAVKRDDDGLEGLGNVHAGGVQLLGSSTLCGHFERHDIVFKSTRKPVSCKACVAIIEQVRRDHLTTTLKKD